MIDFCILGNPRSGTTLLRLMLSTHPDITVPPEAGFAVWLMENWEGEFSPEIYVEKLCQTKKIESWQIDQKELTAYLHKNKVDSLKSAILQTYEFYRENEQVQFIGDKNNFYLDHIDTLKKINSSMSYIHIVRDGRDVACSYLQLMNKKYTSKYAPILPTNITEIASSWSQNNNKIRAGIPPEKIITIRLEDLVEKPENELKRVCKFLGYKYDIKMLDYYKNSDNYEPKEYDEWKSKNKKPIENDNFKFKRILSQADIAEFEKVAADTLAHFGYELLS